MAWTAERRERQMATLEAKKKSNGQAPEYFGDTKTVVDEIMNHGIHVNVDWGRLPMPEAQTAYAKLKAELERAGTILNGRSMPTPGSYICFMCKKSHLGDPRGKDFSYKNQKTGLMQVVEICGENCWRSYQELLITERREREMVPRTS